MKIVESYQAHVEKHDPAGKICSFEKRLMLRSKNDRGPQFFSDDARSLGEPKIKSQASAAHEILSAWSITKEKSKIEAHLDRELDSSKCGIREVDELVNEVELTMDLESMPESTQNATKSKRIEVKRAPLTHSRSITYDCPCCPSIYTQLDKLSKHLKPNSKGHSNCANLYAQQTFTLHSYQSERSNDFRNEYDFKDMLNEYLGVITTSS